MLVAIVDNIKQYALRPIGLAFLAKVIYDKHRYRLHLRQISIKRSVAELILDFLQVIYERSEESRYATLYQNIGYRSCKVCLARTYSTKEEQTVLA